MHLAGSRRSLGAELAVRSAYIADDERPQGRSSARGPMETRRRAEGRPDSTVRLESHGRDLGSYGRDVASYGRDLECYGRDLESFGETASLTDET